MRNRTNHLVNIILSLTALSFLSLRQLRIDLSSFPPAVDTNDVAFYHRFNQQFHAADDEHLIFIALRNKAGIFKKTFLQKLAEFTNFATKLKDVRTVYSVTNANVIFFKGKQIFARPLVNVENAAGYSSDSLYLFQSPEYRDLLISSDGTSVGVAIFPAALLGQNHERRLLNTIETKLHSLRFDETHVVSKTGFGRIIMRALTREFLAFAVFAWLLFGFFSMTFLGGLRPAIFVFTVTVVSILWTAALVALLQLQVQFYLLFVPLLLFLASVINWMRMTLITSFTPGSKGRFGGEKIFYGAAILSTFCFVLLASKLPEVRTLGITAGVGLLINAGLCFVIFPLAAGKSPGAIAIPIVPGFSGKISGIRWLPAFTRKGAFAMSLILLTGISIVFVTRSRMDTRWADLLPASSAMKKDLHFMDANFSGILPFELSLDVRDTSDSFFELPMMKKMEEMERFCRDSCKVGGLISPLSFFRATNKAFSGGGVQYYRLPEQNNVSSFYQAIMQTEHADEMNRYMAQDGKRVRISGRTGFASAAAFQNTVDKVTAYFHRGGFDRLFSLRFTGAAAMAANGVWLINSEIQRLGLIAFWLLVIIFTILYQRLSTVAIGLLLATVPVVLTAAAIRIFDLELGFCSPVLLILVWLISATAAISALHACDASDGTKTASPLFYLRAFLFFGSILLPVFFLMSLSGVRTVAHTGLALCIATISSFIFCRYVIISLAVQTYQTNAGKAEVNQLPT